MITITPVAFQTFEAGLDQGFVLSTGTCSITWLSTMPPTLLVFQQELHRIALHRAKIPAWRPCDPPSVAVDHRAD